MHRCRLSSLLVLVLLALITGVRVSGALVWTCQGRICGSAYGYCCCQNPETCDNGCRSSGKSDSHGATYQEAGCECQLGIQASAAEAVTDSSSDMAALFTAPALVPLSAVVFPEASSPAGADTALPPETRGPPFPASRFASSLSLRAPPFA